jgi:hypothetical protein
MTILSDRFILSLLKAHVNLMTGGQPKARVQFKIALERAFVKLMDALAARRCKVP